MAVSIRVNMGGLPMGDGNCQFKMTVATFKRMDIYGLAVNWAATGGG
jgi:hypothetical protein